MDNGVPSVNDMFMGETYRHERDELKRQIKDYETIIGMFSKALDELVHACEDEIDDYARINRACEDAKKLLPFYQPKED